MKKQIGIYKIIEQGDWEKFYKIINEINAGETFWDDIDKDELAELTFICWELDIEHGVGIYKGFDTKFLFNIAQTLNSGYNCYLKRFKNDNDLTCLIGYMIAVIASPFEASNDGYLEFEEMGKQMLRDAYKNEPANPLLQYLNSNDDEIRGELRPLARERMNQMFEPCPGIRDYFNGILGDN